MVWRMTLALALVAGIAALARPAHAQEGAALCRPGEKVEYAKAGRRYPGEVRGSDGRHCQVYAPDYMGVIDVEMADLRPFSGAPKGAGRPDVAAAGAAVALTAKQITALFDRDPVNTKAQLLGRRVRVTSELWHLGSDSASIRSNLVQVAAKCWIEAADRAEWRDVRDGALITVEGTATDYGNTGIALQGCRLVRQGTAPVAQGGPARPPLGRYFCMNAGQGIGYVTLGATTYTVDGVTGSYRLDPASGRLAFTGGNYSKWGWAGAWRTDASSPGGRPEPRIALTDGKSLRISCYPPH